MAKTADFSVATDTPTTRLKTSGTIVEKLRRVSVERHLTLKSIRDLAGARIVKPMTLDEQDALTSQIVGLWPGAQLIDRRETPSHGYRAVHVVPRISRCAVEIELRTLYQDTWAQAMESFGDAWGRAIRYGGEPDDPERPVSDGSPWTRRQIARSWEEMAEPLYELAQLENRITQLREQVGPDGTSEEIEDLEAQVMSRFQPLRARVMTVRQVIDRQGGG
jgi:ppGpp synthetase/RelA/SpoT-type nucleotidyltranferase